VPVGVEEMGGRAVAWLGCPRARFGEGSALDGVGVEQDQEQGNAKDRECR